MRRGFIGAVAMASCLSAGAGAVAVGGGCVPDVAPPRADRTPAGGLSLGTLLSTADDGDDAGFARATAPIPFVFPDDHGPHATFRSEWWYFTGILRALDSAGRTRRFGYQFTIFRQALLAQAPPRQSAWATRDLYMGHLAISDIDGDAAAGPRFHAFQRLARAGLGLAGANAAPFSVWVESWRVSGPANGGDIFPLTLRARESRPTAVALELTLGAGRGPIPQGDSGLSVKGAGPGNASYYYSCTRLPTSGRLTIGTETYAVEGASWLDREWSTSVLETDVVGWDWLGAHLDDGQDLMFYRLRRGKGQTTTTAAAATAASRAVLIAPDGSVRQFGADAFSLTTLSEWASPDGRARYPSALRLEIPAASMSLAIRPLLEDQELLLAVRYWEGATTISGTAAERSIGGTGYLELTGYAGYATAPAP